MDLIRMTDVQKTYRNDITMTGTNLNVTAADGQVDKINFTIKR